MKNFSGLRERVNFSDPIPSCEYAFRAKNFVQQQFFSRLLFRPSLLEQISFNIPYHNLRHTLQFTYVAFPKSNYVKNSPFDEGSRNYYFRLKP